MIPTRDANHVTEAIALLTDFFRKQPNVKGILTALVTSIQQIEDSIAIYLAGIVFDNAVGDVLDKYGAVLLLPRSGQSDADYKVALRLRLRIILSNGLAEDILAVCSLILASFQYDEWQPASWTILSYEVALPTPMLGLVGKASAAGTRGNFLFTQWPHTQDIVFGSTIGVVADAAGFMDKVSGQFPNLPISSQEFSK